MCIKNLEEAHSNWEFNEVSGISYRVFYLRMLDYHRTLAVEVLKVGGPRLYLAQSPGYPKALAEYRRLLIVHVNQKRMPSAREEVGVSNTEVL